MKKTYNRGFIFLVPAIIIGVTALLGGTVAAAQVSLPDSPLYGIKTATENVRLAVAFTDESKAKTHLSIAKEKVDEIEKLSAKNASADLLEKTEARFADNQSKARGLIQSQSNGSDVAQLNKSLDEIGARNQAVLTVVLTKVPEQAKAGIQNALERSQHSNATSTGAVSGQRENATSTNAKSSSTQGNATSSAAKSNSSATSTSNPGQSNSNKPEGVGR